MSIYESGEGEGGGAGGSMVEESLTAKGGGGAQIACHPALQQKETQQKLAIVVSLVGGLALLSWALSDAEEAYNPHPITPTTTGPNGEIIFIPEGQARKLSAGMEHAAVALPLDYMVQFDLTPHDALVTEWADIIHFTSTGSKCSRSLCVSFPWLKESGCTDNCCDYGDRVPG